MLAMVLVACLAEKPAECVAVQLLDLMPLHQCMVSSQTSAAHWISMHPDHRVKKIRCMQPRDLAFTLSKFRT
ncbi:MAG: hypothetical protein ABWY13_00815 [Mesorhizobium sp.]|jgi:hypothetical protein